jgi:hypothetical protein
LSSKKEKREKEAKREKRKNPPSKFKKNQFDFVRFPGTQRIAIRFPENENQNDFSFTTPPGVSKKIKILFKNDSF